MLNKNEWLGSTIFFLPQIEISQFFNYLPNQKRIFDLVWWDDLIPNLLLILNKQHGGHGQRNYEALATVVAVHIWFPVLEFEIPNVLIVV